MRKIFDIPEIEITYFDLDDKITTSGTTSGSGDDSSEGSSLILSILDDLDYLK